MGSSKKHKDKDREHKRKRKHRSRSKEREHKKHKERDRYETEERREPERDYYDPDREEGELEEECHPQTTSSGGDISLSIEETNKLRAKLGLKPLEVTSGVSQGPEKESLKDDIHRPAKNIRQTKETEKLKEKLEVTKDKRRINQKLSKIKTLGDSDSDEDAATWVRRNRMKQREKEKAEKTAKILEEMDAEFGIGSLVEEEFKPRQKKYTSRDLRGLKVEHDINTFKEGQSVILTLKDRGILDDEDDPETLINVNMVDAERALRNVENKKKKPDYNPYDDAEEDEYGMFKAKEVLSKYDEEIEGERRKKFELGAGGKYNAEEDRQMDRIRDELRATAQTLSTNVSLATEYFTAEEAAAKFKKVKRKVRKIRTKKVLKADDLLPKNGDAYSNEDFGSRSRGRGMAVGEDDGGYTDQLTDLNQPAVGIPGLDLVPQPPPLPPPQSPDPSDSDMNVDSDDEDDVEFDEDLTGVVIEEDQAELELHSALTKARKVKQKHERKNPDKIAEKIIFESIVKKEPDSPSRATIVLNATSEFCRALGDIPTYGQAGNREEIEKDELEEFEKELLEQRRRREEEEEPTGWNRVEIDETPVNLEGEEKPVLEDEPVISAGIGGALRVAVTKGFLEHEKIKLHKKIKNKEDIEAQNYSIEDKRYDDLDEKYKKRDRYSGMLQDFKEKDGYKPEFKLEYVDDSGRNLNRKEAFRQLSHRFHGKGSGKKKTEKRSKKMDEDNLMKRMSSTDTPLNTVALLREKQTQEKTPYIVLSGNKGFTNTMVKPS